MTPSRDVALEGLVVSGLGEGSSFTELEWARDAFREQLGFEPWPGTFNIELDNRRWAEALGEAGSGIEILPPEGFCAARCYRAVLAGTLNGAVVLPDVEGYPLNKIEFLAPVGVRQELGLSDGDKVEILVRL